MPTPQESPGIDSGDAPGDALKVAVTGVTGYVGGRLVPELLAAGYTVRGIARRAERLRDRSWRGVVEIAEGDVGDEDAMTKALQGIDVAYYLVHSLSSGPDFASRDRQTALAFGRAAKAAGVGRIVYLGGLYPSGEHLSPHLASRKEVGEVLLASGVPTTVLRAAVILGSGSASFEMMRYLTERLPAMTTPRWVDNRIQPIAITDVLYYLVGSARMPSDVNRGFDIGGPDVLTYRDMMQRFAEISGLPRRLIIAVPVLTPRLSSHWVSAVTPVPRGIARPLVDSLIHEVICDEHDIERYVPDPAGALMTFDAAVRQALHRIQEANIETRWSSAALPGAAADPLSFDPEWAGGSLYTDKRRIVVAADPAQVWAVLEGLGGESGWYSWPAAWQVRGVLDRLGGGPGLRRGRRDPAALRLDDVVDFWRVEAIEPQRLLRLRAEMSVPGLAWLEYRIGRTRPAADAPDGVPRTELFQRALFHPHGLAGQLYWWSLVPFHGFIFGPMQRGIARAAEKLQRY